MKERIGYVDAMRGLAMLMVVVGHCCIGSFGNHPIFDIYVNQAVQIPLFFLISGFFAPMMLKRPLTNTVMSKFGHLVVPALVMLGLWCLLFNQSFINALCASMKYGYWFTLVLFVFMLIYLVAEQTMSRLDFAQKWRGWIHLIVGVVVSYFALVVKNYSECRIVGIFSIVEYYSYTYFIVGALLFANRDKILKYLSDTNIMGICILGYIVLQIFAALYGIDWMRFGSGIYNLVMHTASLLIVWTLFHKYPVLSTSSKIGRFLSLMGRRSIDVYFIHYFFLPDLHIWGDYFMSIDAQLIEYLCAILLAIPLIYISIGIGCIIRLSPITARLFLGVSSTREKAKTNAMV